MEGSEGALHLSRICLACFVFYGLPSVGVAFWGCTLRSVIHLYRTSVCVRLM